MARSGNCAVPAKVPVDVAVAVPASCPSTLNVTGAPAGQLRPLTTVEPPGSAYGWLRTTVPDPNPAVVSGAVLPTGLGVGLGLGVGARVGVGVLDGVALGVGLGVTVRDGLGEGVLDVLDVGRGVAVAVGVGDGVALDVQEWLTDLLSRAEPLLARASIRMMSVPASELVHVMDAAPWVLVTAYRGQPVLGPLVWLKRTHTPLPSGASVVTPADTVCGAATTLLVLLGDADSPVTVALLVVGQPAARAVSVPPKIAANAAVRASNSTMWLRLLLKVTRGRSPLGRGSSRRRTDRYPT